jgi:hypothetical protein
VPSFNVWRKGTPDFLSIASWPVQPSFFGTGAGTRIVATTISWISDMADLRERTKLEMILPAKMAKPSIALPGNSVFGEPVFPATGSIP